MDELLELEFPPTEPAFSLSFTGLDAGAKIGKVGPVLAKVLKVDAAQLPDLLSHPPLFLMRAENREQLSYLHQVLDQAGCHCVIEPVETYRHWTIPQALSAELARLDKAQTPEVMALIYVRQAPGIAWLQRAAAEWPECTAYPLNHGQMLLQLKDVQSRGAGRTMRDLQDRLTAFLNYRLGKRERAMASALVLYPDDAQSASELLDNLMARMQHYGKPEEIRRDPSRPEHLLARPVAGRALCKLVEQGLTTEEESALSAEDLTTIQQHWPVDQGMRADPDPSAARPGLARIRQQYDLGRMRRLERCWDLIHDSASWDNIPELPQMVMRILMLTKQENSEYSEIGQLVASDPAMSSRVLKIVNSSQYGLKQRIDSLDHALVILGMDEIAELALMLGSEEVFSGPEPELGHSLWRHSATTAEITRALAMRMNWPRPTGLYAAALLHDVGKIVLYNSFREEMRELGRIAKANQLPLYEMEREYFGHDHATIGALLLRRWGIPEHLCLRVELHHGPLPGETGFSEAAALIGIADHLAHRMVKSESWADALRLRQVQLGSLRGELGELQLEDLDGLLSAQSRNLRIRPR